MEKAFGCFIGQSQDFKINRNSHYKKRKTKKSRENLGLLCYVFYNSQQVEIGRQ